MPIKTDKLQEKKDYQRLILDELQEHNDFIIRDAKMDWSMEYAMDTGMLPVPSVHLH